MWHPEELPATKTYIDQSGKICLIRTMLDGDYRITAGTIDGMIEALADLATPDSFFVDDWLVCFRAFTTAIYFFDRMSDRFSNKDNCMIMLMEEDAAGSPFSTGHLSATVETVPLKTSDGGGTPLAAAGPASASPPASPRARALTADEVRMVQTRCAPLRPSAGV